MEDILYLSPQIIDNLLIYCSEDLVHYVLNDFRQNHEIVERDSRPPLATWVIGIAYDRNGDEIHEGDIVIWIDLETRRKTRYKVYEEPTEDM